MFTKKSRVKLIKLSTRRCEDLEICLALSHMKDGETVGNRRTTSRSVSEIEQNFGTSEFEICSDMLKLIKYQLNKPTKKNCRSNDCRVARTGVGEQNISPAARDEEDSLLTDDDKDSDFEEVMSVLTNTVPPGVSAHPVSVSATSSTGGSYQNFSTATSTSLTTRQQQLGKKE